MIGGTITANTRHTLYALQKMQWFVVVVLLLLFVKHSETIKGRRGRAGASTAKELE